LKIYNWSANHPICINGNESSSARRCNKVNAGSSFLCMFEPPLWQCCVIIMIGSWVKSNPQPLTHFWWAFFFRGQRSTFGYWVRVVASKDMGGGVHAIAHINKVHHFLSFLSPFSNSTTTSTTASTFFIQPHFLSMSFSFTDLLSNSNNTLTMDDDPFGLEFANTFKQLQPLPPYSEFPPGFSPTTQSLNSPLLFSSQNVSFTITYCHYYTSKSVFALCIIGDRIDFHKSYLYFVLKYCRKKLSPTQFNKNKCESEFPLKIACDSNKVWFLLLANVMFFVTVGCFCFICWFRIWGGLVHHSNIFFCDN